MSHQVHGTARVRTTAVRHAGKLGPRRKAGRFAKIQHSGSSPRNLNSLRKGKFCPQAFGQDRSWIKEIPAALERDDDGAEAAPLGLLKHALSPMNAELEDAKTADTGAAWNDHCRKYLAITDRMIARVEKI